METANLVLAKIEGNRTLMIDNYDSFTYNVYQYLEQLGANVTVFRNDKITVEECAAFDPTHVVVSPGPGHPSRDAGVSKDVIRHFAGKVPVLGVCMGEQCMCEVYGATVAFAGEIVHGKTSEIEHDGLGLYQDAPERFSVTRYHSLSCVPASVAPDTVPLRVTSTAPGGIIMGVRHTQFVVEGVQYHPESILSEHGKLLFANFLSWSGGTWEELKRGTEHGCLARAHLNQLVTK